VGSFRALTLEIEIFVNEKGKFVAEIGVEGWLWNLTLRLTSFNM
jgi:hypothetical protein